MADVTIADLPAAGAVDDTDLFETEQTAGSRKRTWAALKAAIVALIPTACAYDQIVALGDETTAITTGTAKVTFRAARAFSCSKIKASLTTASTSGLPTFDVKKNGVSVFTTTLTIDANEKTSETAATAAVLNGTLTFAADDEITIDITTAGTGAKGAKITFIGTATL